MEQRLRHILTLSVFPLIFGGAIGFGVMGVERGWDRVSLLVGATVVPAMLIWFLEQVHPHDEDWNQPRGDVSTDLKHLVVSMIMVPEFIRLLLYTSLYAISAWLTVRLGFDFWPTALPTLIQVVLAMLIAEFGSYWAHRLMHENPWLWRLHATHHSAPRLYWVNAARFHPLDTALQYLGHVIPLLLLGCPPDILVIFTIFTGVHGMFQHANIRMKLGPLNWVFSMAELHRWHHSTATVEGNTNYGANLIFWDIVFGSRYLPRDKEPPRTIGIGDMPHFPKGYLAHLASPFNWKEVVEKSAPRLDPESSAGLSDS